VRAEGSDWRPGAGGNGRRVTGELSADDEETIALVRALHDTGNLHPLIERLRGGEVGPERARDALLTLAEFDLDLLVQITLDSLIAEYVQDPGLAHQPHRETRGTGE
jgi:hypothetical protein